MENPSSIASAAAVQEFLVRYLADREKGEDVPLEDYLELFPGHEPAIARKYEEIRAGPATSHSEGSDERTDDPELSPEPFDELERTGFTSEVVRRLAGRGNTFGRYDLKEELARGGQGTILRVWDEDLRRNLAMKLLHEKKDEAGGTTPYTDPRTLGRFLEEAQVTGQLDHPGVVPVHELGVDDEGRVYFTMKLVRGRDLKAVFDLVRTGREGWTQTRALGVMLRVCEAMAYAHSKRVIHRDLKPSNVMVGKFGEVHVMDWGLARILDKADEKDVRIRPAPATADVRSERRDSATDLDSPLLTMDGDVVGTPAYMSPEQALGDLNAMGPRSDVYAVGAMLYHLFAGRMPYVPTGSRLNNYAVWYQVQKGPPEPLSELAPEAPPELVAICERAMAREKSARYADMMELAEDLRAYLEHRVVSAYETGTWAETRKWVQRNRSLAGSLAATLVLLVAGLVTATVLRREAEHQATIAEDRAADVLSLSAFQKLENLRKEADALWPPDPEHVAAYTRWITEAEQLVAGLGDHRAQLVDLRARALPHSAADVELDRRSHPRHGELVELERQLEVLGRAHAAHRGEVDTGTSSLQPEEVPELPIDANALAWNWGGPDRAAFGNEARALALARIAVDGATGDQEPARFRDTLAWVLFANGRFDEARVVSEEALRLAPQDGGRYDNPRHFERLEASIDGTLLRRLEEELGELRQELAEWRSWTFALQEDTWWHAQLQRLVAEIEGFADPDEGLWKGHSPEHGLGIEARLAFAARVEEQTISGSPAAASWEATVARIAASPHYGGVELGPQLGLVPLGRDPDSGLEEFGHPLTGTVPARARDGALGLTEESGLVFVLLPGGPFWMELGRRMRQKELSPLLLSKYEMTQGQWKRLTGRNPSGHGPEGRWARSWLSSGAPPTLLHPVEQVSWLDCMTWLGRAGLVLPSDAQWEYGTRAGTLTPWWTGERAESLAGAANLMDSVGHYNNPHRQDAELWLDDGASVHAPVGSYSPNPFGLHDVAGNVWEWCLDGKLDDFRYRSPKLDPVAPRLASVNRRNYRGGSHRENAQSAKSSRYGAMPPSYTHYTLGLRPARAITP